MLTKRVNAFHITSNYIFCLKKIKNNQSYFQIFSIDGSVAFFQIYVGRRLAIEDGTMETAMNLHV